MRLDMNNYFNYVIIAIVLHGHSCNLLILIGFRFDFNGTL